MATQSNPRRIAALRAFSKVAGTVVILIPCLVLIGWTIDDETLKRIYPGLVAMNPVTAVNFILAGVSLWLLQGEQAETRQTIAQLFGGIIAVVGLLALTAILLNQ
ncbi:MAG: hypothetical protein M3347_18030, partial [Armatimonadota bacterium]|nr:hypothetical protein [Armatimonadota bacterium]